MNRKKIFFPLIPAALSGVALLFVLPAQAAQVTLTALRWNGQSAYRFSDGVTEAIIVPAWGRVMRYGYVGGANRLWNASAQQLPAKGYQNRGGAKTWPAPQSDWPLFAGDLYPPHPTWDGLPMRSQITTAGASAAPRLRLTSGVWKGFGARLTLDFGWSGQGELEITETLEKVEGEPRRMSLWSVAQVPYPDAVFLPKSASSAYKNGFYWFFGGPLPEYAGAAANLSPTLLRVRPVSGKSYKVGVDAPFSSIASVKDGVAFTLRSPKSNGLYPDGADGAGFPVECYNQEGVETYNELELLSPLYMMRRGDRRAHTTRWNLHTLTSRDIESPEMQQEILALLETP